LKHTRQIPLMMILTLMPGVMRAEDPPLLKLEMKDGAVAPQRLEVLAGKPFRLEIKNSGKTAAEFECKQLKKEQVLVPGATLVVEVRALAKGEYKFVDEFREHLPTSQGVVVAK
jgi:Cupredoxin-like domain